MLDGRVLLRRSTLRRHFDEWSPPGLSSTTYSERSGHAHVSDLQVDVVCAQARPLRKVAEGRGLNHAPRDGVAIVGEVLGNVASRARSVVHDRVVVLVAGWGLVGSNGVRQTTARRAREGWLRQAVGVLT